MKRSITRGLQVSCVVALLMTGVACGGSDNRDLGTKPDAGSDVSTDVGTDAIVEPDTCPAPTGEPVNHSGFIEANETWSAGVHTVSSTVMVRAGVTLTLEPCAVVQLAADQSIAVDDEDAHLVARGVAGQPIRFERLDPNAAWGSLNVFAPGTIELSWVTIDGGGTTAADPRSAELVGASLAGRNQTGTPFDTVFVDHVTITRSAGLGVLLDSTGFASGSTNLTVTGAGLNPVYLGAAYATHLPSLSLNGNGDDRVLLQSAGAAVYDSSEPVLGEATLPDPGVPYLVGIEGTHPSIIVGDSRAESPSATLTIEPGVELHFQGGDTTSAGVLVRGKSSGPEWVEQGALIAVGTADQPIVMRSAEATPAPGDWQGLYFQYVVSTRTALEHVQVFDAGGESSTTGVCVASVGASTFDADCSVVLFLEVQPAASFILNSLFSNGNGCGIYRGWRGDAIDFESSNTFTSLSGCSQSNVYNEDARACMGGTCE